MIRQTVAARVERKMATPIDPIAVVDDSFMTVAEIADMFGISTQTVYNAQDAGELMYCSFGRVRSRHPARRTPRRAVLEWAASRLVRRNGGG